MKMNKKGFTLIEVILAVVVVSVAVSATMVVLSKMMGYTINRGQAVDISNAITISQMAIDQVRDQRLPPTGLPPTGIIDINKLVTTTPPTPVAWTSPNNVNYTYTTEIVASDGSGGTSTLVNFPSTPTDYASATNTDLMLGYRNLLRVTVTVFKNERQIFQTMTYKTRNGYY